jgi:hypothetical protein
MMIAPMAEAAPDVTVKVDGNVVSFPDQKPYIDSNDRTMVPVRAPMEAMGCTVDWNDQARQATITKAGNTVVFTIGSNTYTLNGQNKTMDTQAVITGDRTAFPIRFAAEAMGATVTWDQDTYTVNIITGKQSGKLEVDPKIKVSTGNERYMTIVTENGSALIGKGYKFRVECTNHPEFNTMVQRVPAYGPAKYQTVKMDDWQENDIDWFIGTPGTWGCTYDPPAKAGQEIEYRITMKDKNGQIVRVWEGKATLSDEYKVYPAPTLVKGE